MNEFRLQLKLKDGQSLGYIQMRDNKPYYDYGYSEATLFDPVGVLNLLNRISLDKYDVYAEVPYTTNKGRRGTTALKNEELKTYMKNELGKVQVMENVMREYYYRVSFAHGRNVGERYYVCNYSGSLSLKKLDELLSNSTIAIFKGTQQALRKWLLSYRASIQQALEKPIIPIIEEFIGEDKLMSIYAMNSAFTGLVTGYKIPKDINIPRATFNRYFFESDVIELNNKSEQVMENKNMNEKMIDKYGREVDPKEWEEKEARGLNEADEQFAADPEGALADFLGTDVENVTAMDYDHYGIPMYEVDGEEWAVTDDYDLVEEAAKEEVIQLIDELGVESLNWDNMGGIGEYLNMDWFDMAMEESNQFYIDDIREESASSDEYENRLEEEMADAGVETEKDYLEVLNNNYANGYEWYVDNFGQPDKEIIEKAGLDAEKAAQECLDVDGPGHLLSGYDGDMVEHEFEGTTFYMFRQN